MAGKELNNNYRETPAYTFLFNAVLINVRFREKLCNHITYTTSQILESAKSEDYAINFKGFMAIGSNMAFPINKQMDRNKSLNLIKISNEINAEIEDNIKIVAHGLALNNIKKVITDGEYPIDIISVEEALEEIKQMDEKLKSL